MQIVPSPPAGSWTTYERIQRTSSDISSSPTSFDRIAVAFRLDSSLQPSGRRIAYSFIQPPSSVSTTVRSYNTIGRANLSRANGKEAQKRRGAEPRGDPAGGGAACDRGRHRGAVDRPA